MVAEPNYHRSCGRCLQPRSAARRQMSTAEVSEPFQIKNANCAHSVDDLDDLHMAHPSPSRQIKVLSQHLDAPLETQSHGAHCPAEWVSYHFGCASQHWSCSRYEKKTILVLSYHMLLVVCGLSPLHPLHRFPSPKLAAYDSVKGAYLGTSYTFEKKRLRGAHGKSTQHGTRARAWYSTPALTGLSIGDQDLSSASIQGGCTAMTQDLPTRSIHLATTLRCI